MIKDSFITREEAKKIFEEIIQVRNNSLYSFSENMENNFRKHSQIVGSIAEEIAKKTMYLNSEKAYILGLLHDCGRIKDEQAENTFHGWIGYLYMNEKNLTEIARISITHCFYYKDFDMSLYPQNKKQLEHAKNYLKDVEYDDYDKLLQLADMLNDMGKTCSIEYRFESISKRYNIPQNKLISQIKKLNEIKTYFDKKCKENIYEFLNIK